MNENTNGFPLDRHGNQIEVGVTTVYDLTAPKDLARTFDRNEVNRFKKKLARLATSYRQLTKKINDPNTTEERLIVYQTARKRVFQIITEIAEVTEFVVMMHRHSSACAMLDELSN